MLKDGSIHIPYSNKNTIPLNGDKSDVEDAVRLTNESTVKDHYDVDVSVVADKAEVKDVDIAATISKSVNLNSSRISIGCFGSAPDKDVKHDSKI